MFCCTTISILLKYSLYNVFLTDLWNVQDISLNIQNFKPVYNNNNNKSSISSNNDGDYYYYYML